MGFILTGTSHYILRSSSDDLLGCLKYFKNCCFLYAVFKVHFFHLTDVFISHTREKCFPASAAFFSYITGKTSYPISTSLLLGLMPSSPHAAYSSTAHSKASVFILKAFLLLFFFQSGSHLLSHAVSSIVPSAA